MPIKDIAANLTDPDALPWRTCGVCHALAGMNDTDAQTLRGLLADRRVKFTELAKALAEDPDSPTIDRQALSRHATGGCSARENLR
jgi:hypothetical protein